MQHRDSNLCLQTTKFSHCLGTTWPNCRAQNCFANPRACTKHGISLNNVLIQVLKMSTDVMTSPLGTVSTREIRRQRLDEINS